MLNRDEYVAKLKGQLDQWNAEAAKWEAKAKDAQAGMQAEYAKQLEQYHKRPKSNARVDSQGPD